MDTHRAMAGSWPRDVGPSLKYVREEASKVFFTYLVTITCGCEEYAGLAKLKSLQSDNPFTNGKVPWYEARSRTISKNCARCMETHRVKGQAELSDGKVFILNDISYTVSYKIGGKYLDPKIVPMTGGIGSYAGIYTWPPEFPESTKE